MKAKPQKKGLNQFFAKKKAARPKPKGPPKKMPMPPAEMRGEEEFL